MRRFVLFFLFLPTILAGTELKKTYVVPERILLAEGGVSGIECLTAEGRGQAVLGGAGCCLMQPGSSILLDFGKEMQGGVRVVTGQYSSGKPARVRIRFGESVSEACCGIDGVNGACNDHGIRDFEALLPWLGFREFGNSGFRFVRIDLLSSEDCLVREVNAYSEHLDVPVAGSFRCSDDRLNRIWETGAYTVQQCMQNYVWDGVKRDRLVWIGDMHPEIMTINTVFGASEAVGRSLDLVRDETPVPAWMNGISSYSIWWLLIQKDLYLYRGNKVYLAEQQEYLTALLKRLMECIGEDGLECLDGTRFLDWPSNADPEAIGCGLQSMMIMAMDAGAYLADILGDSQLCRDCRGASSRLREASGPRVAQFMYSDVPFTAPGRKQAVALMALAELIDGDLAAACLTSGGVHGFSTFYGYYMLQALSKAGFNREAAAMVSEYWGTMLDLGATTFWEDFDIDWMENAGRIDELPEEGKVDVHKTYGGYCYQGYRHSFCHGWASGPTSWMTEHILGIRPLKPGCCKLLVEPDLGDLDWAEGDFPTPRGTVHVRVWRRPSGRVAVRVRSPRGISVVRSRNSRLPR